MKKIILAYLVLSVFSAVCFAQSEKDSRRVKITCGNSVMYADFSRNATADAVIKLFPLTVRMSNLYGREMCYRFRDALPANEASGRGYKEGEIIYWPPRHSFVIMYRQTGERFNMQHIGQIESGYEIFSGTDDADVTFELAE